MQADLLGIDAMDASQALSNQLAGRVAGCAAGGCLFPQGDGGLAGGEAQAGVLPERFGMGARRCITAQAGQPSNGDQLRAALRCLALAVGQGCLGCRFGGVGPDRGACKLRRLNQLSDQRMQAEAGIDRLQDIAAGRILLLVGDHIAPAR